MENSNGGKREPARREGKRKRKADQKWKLSGKSFFTSENNLYYVLDRLIFNIKNKI